MVTTIVNGQWEYRFYVKDGTSYLRIWQGEKDFETMIIELAYDDVERVLELGSPGEPSKDLVLILQMSGDATCLESPDSEFINAINGEWR